MNTPFYKLSIFLLFTFWGVKFSLTAQSQNDWKTLSPNESRLEFSKLESYYAESFKWSTEERMEYLEELFKVSKQLEQDSLICFYGEKLGTFYREIDSLQLAFSTLNTALNHSKTPASKRTVLNSIGGLHRKSDDMNGALEYYFKALDQAKLLNDGSEAYPIGNISEVYSALGDYPNAIKYLKKSIQISSRLKSPEKQYSLVYDYSYLMDTYLSDKQVDSAQIALEANLQNLSFLDTMPQQKYQDACFVGYYSVANFFIEQNEPKKAQQYIQKSEAAAQVFYLSSIYMLKARNLINQGNFQEALAILNSDIVSQEYMGQDQVWKLQADCYKAVGNYQKALELKEKEIENKVEKFGNDRIRYSAFANVKYETFQKNEEIKALKQNKQINTLTIQNQKYLLLMSLLAIGLVAGVLIFYWKQYQNRKSLSQKLQQEVDQKTRHLKKANEELRVMNFVASHDIKEPIRNIGNYVGLIKRKLPEEQKYQLLPYFDTIKSSTNQLYTLIEDLGEFLALSKDEKIVLKPVELNEIIKNIEFTLEPYIIKKNAKVVTSDLPQIRSNETAIFIILKNLIENGIKFNTSEQPTVDVIAFSQNNFISIHVKDNGIGIEEQYHQKIFESFSRLHDRGEYGGSGVGLAIVKVMIEKLNGKIEVVTHKGNGTSFIVSLPINQTLAEPHSAKEKISV